MRYVASTTTSASARPCFEVAALARAGVEQLTAGHGLVRVEQGIEDLPIDVDQRDRVARLLDRVGADRGDRCAFVVALLGERDRVAGADRSAYARGGEGGGEVDPRDAGTGVRRAQNRGVQHPGQLDVGRVGGLAARAPEAVDARRRAADDLERPGRPLRERVLFDDEPDLFEAALDLLFGADQSRHVRIASSIFG